MPRVAVLALAAAVLAAGSETPTALAKAYRESPTPAKRAALERYASANSRNTNGALARLALGITAFEQKDWPAAIQHLRAVENRLPRLADYVAFHLAAALLEDKASAPEPQALAAVYGSAAPSPLAGRSALIEGRSLTAGNNGRQAVRVLRERYAELPQPEGDAALAAAYEAAGERPRAAQYYQQVYYRYPLSAAAEQASTALAALRAATGISYPEPAASLKLTRADRLMEGRAWVRARAEYGSLLSQLGGPERELALVRHAATYYLAGNASEAYRRLRSLSPRSAGADAERLYYIVESARRLRNDEDMMEAIKRLNRYPKSQWRMKALVSAGNRFLLVNDPERYLPLYKAASDNFPGEPDAPYAHWKVAWHSYLHRKRDADDRMRKHLELFPFHSSAASALYFLGRLAERERHWGEARAYYTTLSELYPNYYYGLQARDRLVQPRLAGAAPSAKTVEYLGGIPFPARPEATPPKPSPATALRIERARLLRSAALDSLAAAELRFGARSGEQTTLLAVELARGGDSAFQRLRFMKSMRMDYFSMPLEYAPPAYWEHLFPLPFRNEVVRHSRKHNLDPFKVAALIRQESEFDPRAVSRASARGLTQVLPGTGRMLAPKVGIRRFNTGMLFQPSINLQLGTYYMRSLLDKWDGKWEETLAAYNAGPNRVTEWSSWHSFEEPAEFIESIPFTETREYVKAVMRNAAMYRLIYQEKPLAAETKPAASGSQSKASTAKKRPG